MLFWPFTYDTTFSHLIKKALVFLCCVHASFVRSNICNNTAHTELDTGIDTTHGDTNSVFTLADWAQYSTEWHGTLLVGIYISKQ